LGDLPVNLVVLMKETNMSTNKRIGAILILLMLAIGLVACAGPSVQAQTNGGNTAVANTITVIGQGEAQGQPDQAHVTVGVEISRPTVEEATNQNATTIEQIMTALDEMGIAAEDIQTSNYGLWAEQRYDEEEGTQSISGYHVTNQVNVTIRNINNVGDVLAAVTNAGANSIYGVSFSVDDTAVLEAQAREAAIADARARAQSLADLAGVELGDIRMITEVVGSSSMPIIARGGFNMAVEESAAPGISPGQLDFHTQIQVTFAIQ
jgi:uncharacterized protein YggE